MELDKFKDDLRKLGKKITSSEYSIETEEATKTSLILPFFQLLGYDIFNPTEFIPEFTADVGIKKGEKVDYAIVLEEKPAILIEAKSITEELTKHDSQLFRYFGTTNSKFGILTNGKKYKFFTDLDEPNKMDSTPFLVIDITNIKENQIPELAKFHKDNYDIDNITHSASELKYLNFIKNFLTKQLDSPSENFVKCIVSEIYTGVKTKGTLDKFKPIIKKGLSQFINEKVNDKLSAALNTSVSLKESEDSKDKKGIDSEDHEVTTTPEDLEAYTTVKLILKDIIDLDRIFYRTNRSYFNILIDNSIRKWVLRLFISTKNMKIVLNDEEKTTIEIDRPLDIALHKDKILIAVNKFL
ncbi:type I restriction endonuclease [Enterococcus sp. DIV1420a]|uniref:type I restriction endonuclease n=1 Tax=Enterococcus sp. DIV1420a TaxID=2774672 RepID=UPI003F226107